MPLLTKAQLGVKDETTYGTPVAVDRFFEFYGYTAEPQRRRIESRGMRPGHLVQRSDRFATYNLGGAGDINMEVLTKGFGWWLKHMLGAVGTAGPTDSAYTHTGTIASLTGDSFTAQVNKPFFPADTDQPFTYHGGKITRWQISNTQSGLLLAQFACDFEDVDTSTSLETASYPTGMELFSFVGATISIGGTDIDVSDITIACDNGLRTDRLVLGGGGLKSEPTQDQMRNITWQMTADFDSLDQYDRYVSATAAVLSATIVAEWEGPTLIGATTYPKVTVTIDQARFDEVAVPIDGPADLQQRLSGRGLYDGSDSAITIAYVSADTTP